ncbi:protein ENHANCED DOWNY MILDEW 2-like [Rosa rugosa]|uniref:protein ENHANCED DOWNY MILDEW 2-like n=1 Tax=Rosa rugosa TaxID=74645 RepID=UPI002B40A354|nr:protein ENHANCED DOWNY MILDEW 2-like [Rosa rugosa]
MASFDNEAEPLPVTNYYFEDDKNEPISFHVLPIEWGKDKRQNGKKEVIYLRGIADNGLQTVHRAVIAWKFDLFSVKPVISVLSKQNKWIVLQRPRKSFEKIIRAILVTLHCLSYVIRNPETSAKSLWEYLANVFSLYEARPSQNDLAEHMPLIREALKWEDSLAKSKFIVNFLEERPTKRKLSDEDIQVRKKPGLSTDDLFDTVCAFCDNGGNLLCCEGRCLRSFHATVKDGEDFTCESLGFTQDEVDAIRKIDFYCKNCQYKQHQCYACGKLGSSDKSLGAEVFPCTSARCGQFYHPHCIAKLRYHETGVSAEELEKRIMLGESFTCPIHKCCFCKQGENKKDPELQFAVCRRCPTSYHRKCLPRDIRFAKGKEGDEEDMDTRAWEGLLPDRVLIYCIKHRIVKAFGTPRRDHVKFPDVDDNKISAEKKTFCQEKKRRLTSESLVVSENCVSMRKRLSSEGFHKEKNAPTTNRQKMTLAAKAGKHSKLKSAIVKPSSRKSSSPSSSLDSARVLRQVDLTILFVFHNVSLFIWHICISASTLIACRFAYIEGGSKKYILSTISLYMYMCLYINI